jgi:hypothetical protein
MLLREMALIRCPNCVHRKRELERCLANAASDEERQRVRAQVKAVKTHFRTTEMKKQSPNRVVIEFRDRFGLKNGHMRSDKARAQFRVREAIKKENEARGVVGLDAPTEFFTGGGEKA